MMNYIKKILSKGVRYFSPVTHVQRARIRYVRKHKNIEFVSYDLGIQLCDQLIKNVSRNYKCVVGVPRSGLFFANVIANKLCLPLAATTDPHHSWQSKHLTSEELGRYLLIDDSYRTGTALNEAIKLLMANGIRRADIDTAALITSEKGKYELDYYGCIIENPRFFEWNMLHRPVRLYTDMDGVLCEDPPANVKFAEKRYEKWLRNAKPYLIPSFEIDTILTSRIEVYRTETEVWLAHHNVKYKNLVMGTEATRHLQRNSKLKHKIAFLSQKQDGVYWESSIKEANFLRSNGVTIPILSIDQMQLQ
jgi:adenine/guanine phosphoribosyltransferase-like PRPP-binding protein